MCSGNFTGISKLGVRIHAQGYKSLCPAIMICGDKANSGSQRLHRCDLWAQPMVTGSGAGAQIKVKVNVDLHSALS